MNTEIHFIFIKCKVISSNASLPTSPDIQLAFSSSIEELR